MNMQARSNVVDALQSRIEAKATEAGQDMRSFLETQHNTISASVQSQAEELASLTGETADAEIGHASRMAERAIDMGLSFSQLAESQDYDAYGWLEATHLRVSAQDGTESSADNVVEMPLSPIGKAMAETGADNKAWQFGVTRRTYVDYVAQLVEEAGRRQASIRGEQQA